MTTVAPETADSHRIERLAKKLAEPNYRHAYLEHYLRNFLADQFRALRGERTQKEFGKVLDKPQSVISRQEDEGYGKHSLQTLLEVAHKLDIALEVRFVDYPTFLRSTDAVPDTMLAPPAYNQTTMDALAREYAVGPGLEAGSPEASSLPKGGAAQAELARTKKKDIHRFLDSANPSPEEPNQNRKSA